MPETIISRQNQYIKTAKSLQQKKFRDRNRLFIMEGVRAIEEGIAGNASWEYVLINQKIFENPRGNKLVSCLEEKNIKLFLVDDQLLQEIAETESPQGILAVARMPEYRLDSIDTRPGSAVLIVDGIQDPGNMGTIIRTACGAGVSGIIMMKGSVDPYNPKVIRSTMGTVFKIPLVQMDHCEEVQAFLDEHHYRTFVAEAEAEKAYFEIEGAGSVAWVLGSEANGPQDYWIAHGNEAVKIPLMRDVESLNVAIAAGILIYDWVRTYQR